MKKLTKKEQKIINDYLWARRNDWHCLWSVYDHYSYNKDLVEQTIKEEMKENDGYGFFILSYNTFMFTCAYRVNNDLVYYTPSQKIVIKDAFIRG